MKKYRLSVLGVSETHLKGCGEKAIGDAVMVYSGVSEGRAKGGVAVIIAGEMRYCLKEWQCVSERLVKVQICFEKKWTTFIQVYAPTVAIPNRFPFQIPRVPLNNMARI